LLLVDEPIQKELEHVDQEIEADGEVMDYHESEDVFIDCVTKEEAEEDKLLMSTVTSDELVNVVDLSSSRLVEVSTSLIKDLSVNRSAEEVSVSSVQSLSTIRSAEEVSMILDEDPSTSPLPSVPSASLYHQLAD
jgi:hypothetical protein